MTSPFAIPVDAAILPLKSLNTPGAVTRVPPEEVARMEQVWKDQFRVPLGKADNDPSNIYATVKVNGEVVATLYNSGGTTLTNKAAARASGLPSMGEEEKLVGPALAAKRAAEIAQLLGGKVEKAATAQTDAVWKNRPAPTWTYDYAAMEAAQKAAQTLFDTKAADET